MELEFCKVVFLLNTICNIPYQIFPCKESLDALWTLTFGSKTYKFSRSEPNIPGFFNFITTKARLKFITVLLLQFTYLTSISFINLEYALSVVGTLNIFIVCILPGLFYISICERSNSIGSVVLVCFGLFLFVEKND